MEPPTKTETSDAGPAVDAPAEFRRLSEKRKQLVKQLAEIDAEIEQVDRELDQDPVPPGLDAAAKVSSAIREFVEAWPKHVEHVERRIETPFRRAWTPTSEVFDAILIVSMALGDVLDGSLTPEALLRAAAAIVDDGVIQAQQALAVDRCRETLEAWRSVKRDLDEKVLDAAAASEKLDFYSGALINALVDLKPDFGKLKASEVASIIRSGRRNQGGVALLLDLGKKASVWLKASEKSLYRAVENHSEKLST